MTENAGKFIWYELMTSDTKAAEKFYRRVLGWDAKDAGMVGTAYTIFSAGPTMIGGLLQIPDELCAAGGRPSWAGYIGVDDVDAYGDRVKAAGGTVHRPPEDIPGVGRFAVVADPYGATFVLFKGESEEGPAPQAPGTPGHVGWHELHAGDGAGAYAFYAGLFGWTKADALDMGPLGVYQTFAQGGAVVGGMMTKMPDTPAPFWLFYFNVEAIAAALARAQEAGATLLMGPHEVPGGSWIVQCLDPQGALFALLAPRR
ncbi:MAG: VOC family protein [Deltaproteobacteria bacterium]|nr:VOC family protein [Deltaproteobacteria bacterium]